MEPSRSYPGPREFCRSRFSTTTTSLLIFFSLFFWLLSVPFADVYLPAGLQACLSMWLPFSAFIPLKSEVLQRPTFSPEYGVSLPTLSSLWVMENSLPLVFRAEYLEHQAMPTKFVTLSQFGSSSLGRLWGQPQFPANRCSQEACKGPGRGIKGRLRPVAQRCILCTRMNRRSKGNFPRNCEIKTQSKNNKSTEILL